MYQNALVFMDELVKRKVASRGLRRREVDGLLFRFSFHTASRMAAWDYELAPYLTRIGSTHSWLNSTLVYPALYVSPSRRLTRPEPRRH
jgi:hypothetical protein